MEEVDINKPIYLNSLKCELYSNDTDDFFRLDLNIDQNSCCLNKKQSLELFKYLKKSLKYDSTGNI